MSKKLKSECFQRFSVVFRIVKAQLLDRYSCGSRVTYSTLFTGKFHDGQICGKNRKYNLAKLAFFEVPLLRNEHKIEIRKLLAVLWRISDRKSTF